MKIKSGIGSKVSVCLLLGTAACSSSNTSDPPTAEATQAVSISFFYLRCNSTSWNVDDSSRLSPTSDPDLLTRSIQVSSSTSDSCSVTEAFASAPNQWGTSQSYFATPNQATLSVPGASPVGPPQPQQLSFGVRYPAAGAFTATYRISTSTLTIGPAGADGGVADAGTTPDASVGDGGVEAGAHDAGGGDTTVDGAPDGTTGSDGASDAGTKDGGLQSGTWQSLTNLAPFTPDTPLLLTDGTVIVHESSDQNWWRLTPNAFGSYVNGTWSQIAPLPAGYGPTYFASAVLPDGRVIVEGGEFNLGASAETTLGAIYNPRTNTWASVAPPQFPVFNIVIGDSCSAVLPNGVFLLCGAGNADNGHMALLNASTLTWTSTGSGKLEGLGEQGLTLLPNGKLLTTDTQACCGEDGGSGIPLASELYDPTNGTWSRTGNTTVALDDSASHEIGPAVLMPNGSVFQVGALGHNGVYNSSTGTWSTAPDFPVVAQGQLENQDGPAALLPNGHVLCTASPDNTNPTHFFEFDGANLFEVAAPPLAAGEAAFAMRLLVLPSGQVLETGAFTNEVEIYTPVGSPNPAWAPTITNVPTSLARGTTNVLHGTQINGLSQAVAYGDDAQAATNYPLVRITNTATGHVFFARTHDHSSMGVATGTLDVSTSFDVSATTETGASTLQVIANGIASVPVNVTIR